MNYVNDCRIIGTIVSQPMLETSKGGKSYCKITVQTVKEWGEKRDEYNHQFTLFGKRAEAVCNTACVGFQCYIIGELTTREYNDREYMDFRVNQFALMTPVNGQDIEPQSQDEDEPF